MKQVKKAGKRLLPLLLTIIMLLALIPSGMIMAGAAIQIPNIQVITEPEADVPPDVDDNAGGSLGFPGLGGLEVFEGIGRLEDADEFESFEGFEALDGMGMFAPIGPMSYDINNPTDRIITMVAGETQYTVDTRPGIAGTTKYLYTHPSMADEFLIGTGNCILDTQITTIWESPDASRYPVPIVAGGAPVYLWAKYVENYPYNPTTMYYRLVLVPPPTGEQVYMQSLAGQSTHPPEDGNGTQANPFTSTIYVPLTKTTINNPDMFGFVGGDIEMTSEGRRFLFSNGNYMNMVTTYPLTVGENHVYTVISSLSSVTGYYYDISLFRGYPFRKEADRLFYEKGDTLEYKVSFIVPETFSDSTTIRVIDDYDQSKVSFLTIRSMTASLGGSSIVLDPLTDYMIQNTPITGMLTITFTMTGKAKLQEGTLVELEAAFNVLSSASGTIINNAGLYFNTDIYGEDEVRVYEKDFTKTAEPNTFTQNNDEIIYTVSFTMPDELSAFDAARIVDILPTSGLAYMNQATLTTSQGSQAVTMVASGNTLYYEITGNALSALAGDTISLAMVFRVSGWSKTDGAIKNEAEIYFRPAGGNYPQTPDAKDDETIYPLDVTDFSKDAALGTYTPGGKIDYTVSWTLPSNALGIKALRVVDNYDATKVQYGGNVYVFVGGNALVANTDYITVNNDVAGTLTTTLTATGIAKLVNSAVIEFKVSFNVFASATGDIENNAQLFYNQSIDPDGEDDEIVYEDDFEKDVKLSNYAPGSKVEYEINVTLPTGIQERTFIEIVDTYPAAYLGAAQIDSLTIGGVALNASQFGVTFASGSITVRIDRNIAGHFDFRQSAGQALVLKLSFIATADASGNITNTAIINYDYDIGGKDDVPIDENEFSKDPTQTKYIPGEKVDYTVSWLLPKDTSSINAVRVVDSYDISLVSFGSVLSFSIGGINLIPNTDYTIANNATAGTLTVTLTPAGIAKLVNEALVELKVEFNVDIDALDTIFNNAKMFYNSNTEPDGEDDAEIVLAVGPPTEVEDLPGDRKTALLWGNPAGDNVIAYQIQIDNYPWQTFTLAQLTFDPTSGANGRWYLLFEDLPGGGGRLVNDVEYTFKIRAVTFENLIGPPFEIKSTPNPLGDIGGRNTDLLSIYGINIMPAGGWPNDGTGTLANPTTASMPLTPNFLYAVIHRNFILVGQDATFVLYSDPAFTNEVVLIDRLDNSFNWQSYVNVYVHVTSGNRQLERYYNITVTS